MIRAAVPDDAEEIARVHVTAWSETYRGLLADDVIDSYTVARRRERWEQILTQDVPGAATFVAEADGQIIGFASTLPQRNPEMRPVAEGEIAALYLLSSYHRQGFGTALWHVCLTELRRMGWGRATFEVHRGNAAAIAFYDAQGAEFHMPADADHLIYTVAL